MPQCQIGGCDHRAKSLKGLKRHYRNEHAGEIETPSGHLGGTESEQRDFAGDEPTTDGHSPEYENPNDPDGGEKTRLDQWEKSDDE